jgi:uncharacterized protein with NAD-binding domain and iron-sulfur cluster
LATTVAVLGGGVAGLSAAHELAERGFTVTVFEGRETFGGKARSLPVPNSGLDGRPHLPAEHGFRFFPGFYRHLPDTMARIPRGQSTVADHLVPATRLLLAQADGRPEIIGATQSPASFDDLQTMIRFAWDFGTRLGIPHTEVAWFLDRVLTLLTSCDQRRFEQWERQSWWEFVGAEQRSGPFQKFLADGLTRTLVAARGREMSARTGGLILCQLLFDLTRVGGRADRVLDAPTSEVWIDPWVDHLRAEGVVLRAQCTVAGIACQGGRVAAVTVQTPAGTEVVTADYYVAALPVERLRLLISNELRAADPALANLSRLAVRWMNGMMFYLARDVPLQHGHAIFADSEWALTAISQAQFWPGVDLRARGNGDVAGILSVDISEWDRPGRRTGKVAMSCTPDEIRDEVWGQLTDHIDDGSLDAGNVVTSFLDPAIVFPNPTGAANLEPLLINTANSWFDRPDAVTRIPNFLLAADFVRTHTDLATMEGANEAARRAVNGILAATGSNAPPCAVWKLREPLSLVPFRQLDELKWRIGRRGVSPPLRVDEAGALVPTGPVAKGVLALSRQWARRGATGVPTSRP